MLETNPFSVFCPPSAKYFVLGSFVAKDGKKDFDYNWYYSNGRNQFWRILENIFDIELNNKQAQQALFTKLKIAVGDIILRCERLGNSSLDARLTNFEYNVPAIENVLLNNNIQKIFFTSRFVEKHFKKNFKNLIDRYPDIELITLPSPSPRYALITKDEKIMKYSEVFPKI